MEPYTNPFIGLRSYNDDESHLFFGRNKQIQDVITNLKSTGFTAVIGSSGSGKSSLIKSGVVPRLKNDLSDRQNEVWKVGFFSPEYDPIGNLVDCLCNEKIINLNSVNAREGDARKYVADTLRKSSDGISEILNDFSYDKSQNILLIVDQFEEIFRNELNQSNDQSQKNIEAHLFINLLLGTLKDQRIYVAISMRSDFLGNCTQFYGLPEALNKGQYLIPRMTREQFREIIVNPIKLINASITDSLLDLLLKKIQNKQDQLPILQHALMRIIDFWKKETDQSQPIDIPHYEAIGGLEKSLSNHANEAYEELANDGDKLILEQIFKSLTDISSNSKGVRRPCKLGDLSTQLGIDKNKIIEIVDVFRLSGRSFLMPPKSINLHEDDYIDISHESLMRDWDRLKTWINEEFESSKTYINLCKSAELYQDGKGSLLVNPELSIVLKWREKQLPNEIWGSRYDESFFRAINYLEDSKTKFDQEVIKKSLAQSKKAKRLKVILYSVSVVAIALAFLTFLFDQAKKEAEEKRLLAIENQIKADENAQKAIANQIKADENAQKAEDNAKIAEKNQKQAEKNAQRAEDNAKIAEKNQKQAEKNAQRAEDNAKIAEKNQKQAEENETKAKNQEQIAKNNAKENERLKNISDAIKTAFEAEKNLDLNLIDKAVEQSIDAHKLYLDNSSKRRQNQIYSALNRSLFEGKSRKNNFYNHTNSMGISTIHQNSISKEFMGFDNSNELLFFKLDDSKKIVRLNYENYKNIDLAVYSSNGEYIICSKRNSNNGGELLIFNEKNKKLIKRVEFSAPIINLQSFKNLNQQLLAFEVNDSSFIMNLSTLDYHEFKNIDKNKNYLFSLSGRFMVTKKNNKAFLYQVSFNQSKPTLELMDSIKSSSKITSYQFSSNEDYLALGNSKGIVSIIQTNDPSKSKTISKHKDVKISDLEFIQINAENFIVSASYDNTINLTNINDIDDFIELKGHKSWVKNITVDQKNNILYSVSEDSSFRYWYLDQNVLVNQLIKLKNGIK